jgi:hypothetical protein
MLLRVNNLVNPYLELFAFNYKHTTLFIELMKDMVIHSSNKSALELVNEVRNELNYDLTYFMKIN